MRVIKLPQVSISPGNRKMGGTPSVSLPPRLTCREKCSFKDSRKCYAIRMMERYPSVRKAWHRNLIGMPVSWYFRSISRYLKENRPKYFRWHVGGDIPSKEYFADMKKIAEEFPQVSFLCFTRWPDLLTASWPENLKMILSVDPVYGTPWSRHNSKLPRAFIKGHGKPRSVITYIECGNRCEQCRWCWTMEQSNRMGVMFKMH